MWIVLGGFSRHPWPATGQPLKQLSLEVGRSESECPHCLLQLHMEFCTIGKDQRGKGQGAGWWERSDFYHFYLKRHFSSSPKGSLLLKWLCLMLYALCTFKIKLQGRRWIKKASQSRAVIPTIRRSRADYLPGAQFRGETLLENLYLSFIYPKMHPYYWLWNTPAPANGVYLGWKWSLSNNYLLFLSVPQYWCSKCLLKELNTLLWSSWPETIHSVVILPPIPHHFSVPQQFHGLNAPVCSSIRFF